LCPCVTVSYSIYILIISIVVRVACNVCKIHVCSSQARIMMHGLAEGIPCDTKVRSHWPS